METDNYILIKIKSKLNSVFETEILRYWGEIFLNRKVRFCDHLNIDTFCGAKKALNCRNFSIHLFYNARSQIKLDENNQIRCNGAHQLQKESLKRLID